MRPPILGMKLIPDGIDDSVMGGAWAGLVCFAAGEPEMRAAFTKETGHDLACLANLSPLERMIDKATDHDRAVLAAFADWVTERLWGPIEPEPT